MAHCETLKGWEKNAVGPFLSKEPVPFTSYCLHHEGTSADKSKKVGPRIFEGYQAQAISPISHDAKLPTISLVSMRIPLNAEAWTKK